MIDRSLARGLAKQLLRNIRPMYEQNSSHAMSCMTKVGMTSRAQHRTMKRILRKSNPSLIGAALVNPGRRFEANLQFWTNVDVTIDNTDYKEPGLAAISVNLRASRRSGIVQNPPLCCLLIGVHAVERSIMRANLWSTSDVLEDFAPAANLAPIVVLAIQDRVIDSLDSDCPHVPVALPTKTGLLLGIAQMISDLVQPDPMVRLNMRTYLHEDRLPESRRTIRRELAEVLEDPEWGTVTDDRNNTISRTLATVRRIFENGGFDHLRACVDPAVVKITREGVRPGRPAV